MHKTDEHLQTKTAVQSFWSKHPCSGLKFNTIDQLIAYRKRKDPVIHVFLNDLALSKDDYVLDIGCGQGADITVMRKNFSHTFGGDIAIGSLKRALHLNPSLNGKIMQFDANALPFQSNAFNAIYSHGVIHHSPNIEKSIEEIYRVLKPGGRGRVLLYSKNSPKGMGVRFIRLLFSSKITKRVFQKIFPNAGSAVDELFLCPVMNMHTRAKVRHLFQKFTNVKNEAWHIGIGHLFFIMGISTKNPLHRCITYIESIFERFFGFYWVVTFQKPETTS